MKIKASYRRDQGMTLFEVAVVVAIILVLLALLIPAMNRQDQVAPRISCINNLKQLGTAYRVWENDNGDLYPAGQSEALGGMQELIDSSSNAGRFTFLSYAIMQNELGQSPQVVLCPNDERNFNTNFYFGAQNVPPGTTWSSWLSSNQGNFDNTNVSYFCGVGALDTYPQSILGGDRNLGNEGDPNYGISGTTANPGYPCGADAIVNTNGHWLSAAVSGGGGSVKRDGLVSWSKKMHSAGNAAGGGNILLGDGGAQECTSAGLRLTWLRNAENMGNFATNDTVHSGVRDIRLLFP